MKNQSELPEAIILTMPVAFFKDRMGYPSTYTLPEYVMEKYLKKFADQFERYMRNERALWNYRKTSLPTQDIAWVYLVWSGKIQFRLNFVQYERNVSKSFDDSWDGKVREFPRANWIILSGPAIKPPYEMPMKGFQGHRYTQKIF